MRVHIPKQCTYPGCKAVVYDGTTRCKAHTKEIPKRPHTANKNASFYNSRAWKNLSYKKRLANPLCEDCLSRSVYKQANIVDHVIEINDDYSKRLDWDNLKSLCYSCHSIKTHGEKKRRQKETVSGYWLIEQIKQIKRKDNKK